MGLTRATEPEAGLVAASAKVALALVAESVGAWSRRKAPGMRPFTLLMGAKKVAGPPDSDPLQMPSSPGGLVAPIWSPVRSLTYQRLLTESISRSSRRPCGVSPGFTVCELL